MRPSSVSSSMNRMTASAMSSIGIGIGSSARC